MSIIVLSCLLVFFVLACIFLAIRVIVLRKNLSLFLDRLTALENSLKARQQQTMRTMTDEQAIGKVQ